LVGLQTFQVMFNVLILSILGIVSLGYMALVYEKEWFGGSYKNNKRKWLNIISFAFIGLVAAYTPYLLGIGNLFFGYVDHLNGGHNTLTLHLINLFTFFVAFIPADMFRSLDGKSGILYRMPKRILTPLPNYNSLDYRLNKFFGLV